VHEYARWPDLDPDRNAVCIQRQVIKGPTFGTVGLIRHRLLSPNQNELPLQTGGYRKHGRVIRQQVLEQIL
jgi:hypothetical protein